MDVNKPAKPHTRKSAFLLFEMLIALALIALCLFPLIKPHASMRQVDRKRLEYMQLERVSQVAFCELKQILYENQQHSWKELKRCVSGTLSEPFKIVFGKDRSTEYFCHYLCEKDSYSTKNKKHGLVLRITLNFTSAKKMEAVSFQRFLFLERDEI